MPMVLMLFFASLIVSSIPAGRAGFVAVDGVIQNRRRMRFVIIGKE
jgi:hypothetical protein